MKILEKRNLQILFGFVVSALFLYLTFKDVDLGKMIDSSKSFNYFFLLISISLVLISLLLKSLRWAWILRPIIYLDQRMIFPISSIGIAAITILPLRLGEIVRPYLVSRLKEIPFSSALASILFERLMDSLMIFLLLSIVVLLSSLPEFVIKTGQVLFLSFVVVLILLTYIYKNQERSKVLLNLAINFLPKKIKDLILKFFDKFFLGLLILSSPIDILRVIILSIILWVVYVSIANSMFQFHNFDLPLIAAFSVVLFTFLAASLPAAPGFLGTFQYGCFLALTAFNVPADQAALFSLTYYVVMVGINVILGIIVIPFVNLDFNSLKNKSWF